MDNFNLDAYLQEKFETQFFSPTKQVQVLSKKEIREKFSLEGALVKKQEHREKSIEDLGEGRGKKYSVLVPSSLNDYDTFLFLHYIVNGRKIEPDDTLNIIIFGNKGRGSMGNTRHGKIYPMDKKVREARGNNFRQVKKITQYFQKINPNFQLDIYEKLIDYPKHANTNRPDFLDFLLGAHKDSDKFFTIGHGFTTDKGFRTFNDGRFYIDNTSGRGEGIEVSWEEYFANDKWLDLSCGSTSLADPFSNFQPRPNPQNKDGLIRYKRKLFFFVKKGFEIKNKMKEYYLRHVR